MEEIKNQAVELSDEALAEAAGGASLTTHTGADKPDYRISAVYRCDSCGVWSYLSDFLDYYALCVSHSGVGQAGMDAVKTSVFRHLCPRCNRPMRRDQG